MFKFKNPFGASATVAAITASFDKQAAKLEALVEQRDIKAEASRARADELKAQAAAALAEADAHEAEADRALAVSARIRDLLA